MKLFALAAAGLALLAAAPSPAQVSSAGSISIDTSNSSDWKISNGVLTVDWLPGSGRIFSMHWSAFPNQELIDQTNRDHSGPKGFYMDNAGLGYSAPTNHFYLDPNGRYIDWWIERPADAAVKNSFTWQQHDIMFPNDPGIHIYFVLDHGPGDPAGGIGQIQWVMRGDLSEFTNTYSVNSGLSNLGATSVPLPNAVLFGTSDKGRNVQDATVDLHGLNLPAGYRREFYTKYDYSSYEYLHHAEGVYGSTMAAWMVAPSSESLTGGPTKQDLIFTGNLLIMEAYSNHLDNQMSFHVPANAVMRRLYGPFYLHFNAFSSTYPTPGSLYREALSAGHAYAADYNMDSKLVQSGYVPSTARGEVQVKVNGTKGMGLNQAWAVLSDNQANFQYSHAGNEYWVNVNPAGVANFHNVTPGTYRLSVYALGRWGELRRNGVNVAADQTTRLSVNFAPENFSSDAPIWTIGTADRSSHEFLHGQITNPIDLDPNFSDRYTARLGNTVQDDREYWGNWNYWADFASTSGAVIYYATPVGSTPATNDLSRWNYNQWHLFNPGLYDPANDSTDGYKYLCPSYVGDCATTPVPNWQVHFTTTPDQQEQGQYVIMSVGVAAAESSLVVSLNGKQQLVWYGYGKKNADAAVRSGFSGTYQWVVFQWPVSDLNPPGQDNVVTFNVGRTQGDEYDALRMEISSKSANPAETGWNDYDYADPSGYSFADDAVNNQ